MEQYHPDLSRLLDRYFEGSCSKEELQELFDWVRLAQDDSRLYERLRQEWEGAATRESASAATRSPSEPDWDQMFSRIIRQPEGTAAHSEAPVRQLEESGRKVGSLWKWVAAAAVILAFIGTGSYFINFSPFQGQQSILSGEHQIVPGGNKAVLTLADGSRIVLDSAADGLLARQGNTAVKKDRNGRLVYLSMKNRHEAEPPAMNIVSTPRGGQYQVRLPDGTAVWLNAASSLKFPASFTAQERHVELTGEAYFEVARDDTKPFIVSSGGQTVEVLGTHFNISAYDDEPVVKTTLLEGSVRVVERRSGKSLLLNPGQEAKMIGSGEITVAEAIPGQAIAWKDGKFMFNGESTERIMRRIARWYDVEVVYHRSARDVSFTGSVSRFADVADVLRKLELTGTIHFKIEGRRIIVMP